MKIFYTKAYSKKIDKLLSSTEKICTEDEIAFDPFAWPVIKGTGGIRKARAKRSTSGKSGGIRIIYYYYTIAKSIYMLAAYAKNESENLSESDKKNLSKIVKSIKEE